MTKRKVFRIIDNWDEIRKKTFKNFISSPYFNTNPDVVNLFESYRNNKTLSFSESKKKNLCFKLLQLVERFLIVEASEKEKHQSILLAEAIADNDEPEFAKSVYAKLKKLDPNDPENIHARFVAHSHLIYATAEQIKHERIPHLEEALSHLDHYYYIQKQQHQQLILQSKRISLHDYRNDFMQCVQSMPIKDSISLCWKFVSRLNNEDDAQLYKRFKPYFVRHLDLVSIRSKFHLTKAIIRYVVSMVQVSKRGFDLEYIYWVDYLSSFSGSFRPNESQIQNAVTLALNAGLYEKARQLISIDSLDEHNRAILRGQYYFYVGKYNKALEMAHSITSGSYVQITNLMILKIRCYYELGELSFAYKLAIKLRKRVHSSKNNTSKKRHLDFCSVVIDLIMKKTPWSKLKLQVSKSNVANKAWLLAKIHAKINQLEVSNILSHDSDINF